MANSPIEKEVSVTRRSYPSQVSNNGIIELNAGEKSAAMLVISLFRYGYGNTGVIDPSVDLSNGIPIPGHRSISLLKNSSGNYVVSTTSTDALYVNIVSINAQS